MSPKVKRQRSPSLEKPEERATNQSKKLKLLASHAIQSPFPDYERPTPTEAQEIHDLLSNTHPDISITSTSAESNNAAGTCGKVPNVLESLIGTILSQNTSSHNSTAAKQSLDETFGRNNFEAIANAEKKAVVEAIRMGGLANKKAEVIQRILRQVKERHGIYSLQHLAGAPDETPVDIKPLKTDDEAKTYSNEAAMKELVSFEGVGPKTASCVLLFCLGRSSFPVDTHVFRLSRLLGWVPAKADRVTAQAHLDIKIPDQLKYGLHVLMVGHGRRCKGCKNGRTGKGDCVLKAWLRTRRGVKAEDLDALTLTVDQEAEEKFNVNAEAAV